MTNNLKLIVNNDHPDYSDMLNTISSLSQDGKVRGLALIYIVDDSIYTDYAKSHGTPLPELLGALEVLKMNILDKMME